MKHPPVLELQDMSKFWEPNTPILDTINLSINRQTLNVITGPSGSGKSTLCAIGGLIELPTHGEVWFDGKRTDTLSERERAQFRAEHIGFAFQAYHLLAHRSVFENVALRFAYVANAGNYAEHIDAILDTFGLASLRQRKAARLSGGEAQRVAIARALVKQPRLLIADEPTGNLDADNSRRVMQHIRAAADSGVGVLVVTHDEQWLDFADEHYRCAARQLHRVVHS